MNIGKNGKLHSALWELMIIDIFIHIGPGLTDSRDEIEDVIENVLEERGEITGGGSGNSGSNIDIEIYNDNDEKIVQKIKKVLEKRYPKIHFKMIVNGKNMPLSSNGVQ